MTQTSTRYGRPAFRVRKSPAVEELRAPNSAAPILFRLPEISTQVNKSSAPTNDLESQTSHSIDAPPSSVLKPAEAVSTSPANDMQQRRSWWEHWSSGVVLILLVIAIVTASIMVLQEPQRQSREATNESQIANAMESESNGSQSPGMLDGIELPIAPERLAAPPRVELNRDLAQVEPHPITTEPDADLYSDTSVISEGAATVESAGVEGSLLSANPVVVGAEGVPETQDNLLSAVADGAEPGYSNLSQGNPSQVNQSSDAVSRIAGKEEIAADNEIHVPADLSPAPPPNDGASPGLWNPKTTTASFQGTAGILETSQPAYASLFTPQSGVSASTANVATQQVNAGISNTSSPTNALGQVVSYAGVAANGPVSSSTPEFDTQKLCLEYQRFLEMNRQSIQASGQGSLASPISTAQPPTQTAQGPYYPVQ
ncbi:MAG: hypothetical protein KDB03_10425 [Planctomycetales bacterium]|nr:hypothetical protein [Planctomycetales bacterium]